MEGNGTMTLVTGEKIIGKFKDNKINGKGIYRFNDGT